MLVAMQLVLYKCIDILALFCVIKGHTALVAKLKFVSVNFRREY